MHIYKQDLDELILLSLLWGKRKKRKGFALLVWFEIQFLNKVCFL